MSKKEINKEDINILHWSIISRKFRCFFELRDLFYEINLDTNFILANSPLNDLFVKNYISENIKFAEDVTLSEILSNEDDIMLSTPLFRKRVTPYIKKIERNKKINNIIYGS